MVIQFRSLFQKRYFVLHVDVQKAHKRKFDSSGKEINPNFSETQKVGTGYLNKYSKHLYHWGIFNKTYLKK